MAMRTLLITDDQEGVLQALDCVLTHYGYQTVLTKSGAAALELARSQNIDAALVDLHMPGMDGVAVCSSLCAFAVERGRALPVWIMTGAFTTAAATRAVEAGAVRLLKKPFDFGALLDELEKGFASLESRGTAATLEGDPGAQHVA